MSFRVTTNGRVHLILLVALLCVVFASADRITAAPAPTKVRGAQGSIVNVEKLANGSFLYVVDGHPQVFIGMGYNPIYRYLPDDLREANYVRDFRLLSEAGVNHILGWDADKGYEQDKFDELTLRIAQQFDIGVVMPFNLPPEGEYGDSAYCDGLQQSAAEKIARFKDNAALRMWGVGNEVLPEMDSEARQLDFLRCYAQIADLFHTLDPRHPVLYRESEDTLVPILRDALGLANGGRPWLLYGSNVYTMRLSEIVDDWPSYGLDRPLFITEFGPDGEEPMGKADGYLAMWQVIRSRPDYVMGGAPYAWTTEGPEPTDEFWGLMYGNAEPVDDAFERLAAAWQAERAVAGINRIGTSSDTVHIHD